MSAEAVARYRDAFAAAAPALPGAGGDWLARIRRDGLEQFCSLGFPSTRHEAWKYTDIGPIARRAFTSAPAGGAVPADLSALVFPAPAHVLVFVDGHYVEGLSRQGPLPKGVVIEPLAQALACRRAPLEAVMARQAQSGEGLAALNCAFADAGVYVELPPGAEIEHPVQVLFYVTRSDLVVHPFNLIHAGPRSRISLVEHFAGAEQAIYWNNAVTHIDAASDAGVEHYRLQAESLRAFHTGRVWAGQERGSRVGSHSFALGGRLSRVGIDTTLGGAGCEAALNGLYMLGGRQHADHHTCIDHAQPRGTSREYYKGIMDGHSRAVFNGRVVVQQDAQKTDAQQSNRNLLLSRDAEVDTKPELEIYADDVKCAHGATIAQLDEAQVFYLRSRGVGDAEARAALTWAFAEEIVGRVTVAPLRARLDLILQTRLPAGINIRT